MALILYGHAFSSYTQKALIALHEKALEFEFRELSPDHPEHNTAFAALWPISKFPLLVKEDGAALFEASIIIEYLDRFMPTPVALIPADPEVALQVRLFDRIFDNHVMNVMQVVVAESLRPEARRDPVACDEARAALDRIYAWLEGQLAGKTWAVGDTFTLADCAAAPSLFYADWVHRIAPEMYPVLAAYRARLNARPSFARCIEEARYFRPYFPLGAPDRD